MIKARKAERIGSQWWGRTYRACAYRALIPLKCADCGKWIQEGASCSQNHHRGYRCIWCYPLTERQLERAVKMALEAGMPEELILSRMKIRLYQLSRLRQLVLPPPLDHPGELAPDPDGWMPGSAPLPETIEEAEAEAEARAFAHEAPDALA
jgi:hypothetical protein